MLDLRRGNDNVSKTKRLIVLAGLFVLVVLGCVVAWQGRYWIMHLVRVAWRRLTLSREPQQIEVARCPGAPWALPTSGVLGVLWNDTRVPPYGPGHPHTGLDIFGQGGENTVPVYAVADGWLTRLPGWKSAVIIRHEDPLRPGETVWTYYSHMASAAGASYILDEFPGGTAGVPVQAGQLIGYQGVWSGHPLKPGWMHLHFSVVRAAEDGSFLNETVPGNTLDPSPYLGIDGNADEGYANWQELRCSE
jgi:murein DD-endopeptidase MepM/ murein hydrolase activator NlpD